MIHPCMQRSVTRPRQRQQLFFFWGGGQKHQKNWSKRLLHRRKSPSVRSFSGQGESIPLAVVATRAISKLGPPSPRFPTKTINRRTEKPEKVFFFFFSMRPTTPFPILLYSLDGKLGPIREEDSFFAPSVDQRRQGRPFFLIATHD